MSRRAALLLLAALAACGDDGAAPADAAPAPVDAWPCDFPAPTCKDPETLTTCDLARATPIDVSCAATPDARCGVGADGRAACIEPGVPCGPADDAGACTGPIFQLCDVDGNRLVTDCRDHYGTCGDDPLFGVGCVSACSLVGVDAGGSCDSAGRVVRCAFTDGVYAVVTETCALGTVCAYAPTGGVACLPTERCDLGPTGRCTGEVAERCDGGASTVEDCAASGLVCASTTTGVTCAPAATAGARALRGTVRYEDRVPGAAGLGPRTPRPAGDVMVAVVADATEAVLATAATASDGTFTLRFDAPDGTLVHALAVTATPSSAIRVLRPDGLLHGVASASTPVGDTTVDLLATDVSGAAPAFNVLDVVRTGAALEQAAFGTTAPIDAVYARGSDAGTYYDGRLHLIGTALDDDGHDDSVIAHELGHHIEVEHSATDSPGGDHDGTPTDPRLAWSEGFATWFAAAALDAPLYVDTSSFGGFAIDAEAPVTPADPGGPLDQDVSEDLVTEVLWDLMDAPVPDDDPAAGPGAAPALQTIGRWLRNAHPDRGVTGVDLVDALDGWVAGFGVSGCVALRAIVVDTHGLPYDGCD